MNYSGEPTGVDLPRRFYKLEEVAHQLATSIAQVYALVRSGELPAIKIGGRGQWRVEDSAFEKWIQQQYDATREWVQQNPLGA